MYHFKITFALERNFLPREMDRLIVSFMKAATQTYSKDLYESLYDKSKSIIKRYTFSYYLPGASFHKDKIELDKNEFTMFFSDIDPAEQVQFFNAFQAMKFKKYPMNGNSMQLVSISMQKLNDIRDNEIIIKIQSPLIVRRHNPEDNSDIYYTYEMNGFENALKDNVTILIDRLNLPLSTEDFSIQVIKGKKVVVPVFGRNVDASLGIYKITGSCQLLCALQILGLGVRRSEGHGKFEVIG